MCGIAGFVGRETNRETLVKGMLAEIQHRGPDDTGFWADEYTALGHNRLSIIDLSRNGRQPMVRGPWVIIYNGEIYNYRELRQELQHSHHQQFRTETDTEVVLAAWEVWGKAALDRFRGMWAFALYNSFTGELILTRDRFGIKPLYYFSGGGIFIFASEIKALLTVPVVPRKACLPVVSDFLLAGFRDHGPDTFYNDIYQLLPGHCLLLNVHDGEFKTEPYYDLSRRVLEKRQSTIKAFEEAFLESIRLHLRSDVPVGTCLSGGLDSSSVATAASQIYYQSSGKRFSAVFAQSGDILNDETEYARSVAENADLDWHVTAPTLRDYQENWWKCLWHQEEPTGGPSVFMQYWVMKTARQAGIKVMLDGQGGDEILLGYERYYPAVFMHWIKAGRFGTALREFIAASRNSKLAVKDLAFYSFYFLSPQIRKLRLKNRLRSIPPELLKGTLSRVGESARYYGDLLSLQISEISRFQLPQLLKYEDRNSMAWSVEARVPFVDHEVVESALTLKHDDKIRNGYSKFALRCVMNGKMPDSITWRRNKIGFEAPTNWLTGERPWKADVIGESKILKEMGLNFLPDDNLLFERFFNVAQWESTFNVRL